MVDDGSTDGAITYLEDHLCLFENVRLVRQARAGPAGARNRGAAEARGDVLVFLDAQSFPRCGWLDRMLAALEQYPDAMVMPTIAAAGAPAYAGYGLKFRDDLSLVSLTERPSGLLLPDAERLHLRHLQAPGKANWWASKPGQDELRRLRALGLIRTRGNHFIADLKPGGVFDIKEYVELTDVGRQYLEEIDADEAT